MCKYLAFHWQRFGLKTLFYSETLKYADYKPLMYNQVLYLPLRVVNLTYILTYMTKIKAFFYYFDQKDVHGADSDCNPHEQYAKMTVFLNHKIQTT